MGYNFNTGINNAVSLASVAGSSGGLPGYIGGAVAGLSSGFFGNDSNSANQMSIEDMYNLEMYNTIKQLYMMNVQDQYNTNSMAFANSLTQKNMKYSSALQKDLNRDAYKYNLDYLQRQYALNRKFAEDSYPIAVDSLKRAGLNPLLATPNGASGSVGLPSASAGSVGGSSVGAMSVSNNSSYASPEGIANALVNQYKARLDKAQLGLNTSDLISNIKLRDSQSAKNLEEAKSQESVRNANNAKAKFDTIQAIRESIKNSFLPQKEKAEIDKILAEKEAVLGNLEINRFLAPFQAENLKKTGNSAVTTAKSSEISAQAHKIEAESGNVVKALTDTFKGFTGMTPHEVGELIRKHKYNPVNFYRDTYNGFINAYKKGQW